MRRLQWDRREAESALRRADNVFVVSGKKAKLTDYLPAYVENIEAKILDPAQCPTSPDRENISERIRRYVGAFTSL